jgi:antitoxin component of MazEF toxin-antitoxin module
MNTSPKKFRVILLDAEDGSDDCILPIPDAVMTELGWKIGDALVIDKISDGIVVISTNPANSVESLDEEVVALAEEVFGDRHKATDWLLREHRLLGTSPAAYLNNGNPKTAVLKMLQSIMHGGAV